LNEWWFAKIARDDAHQLVAHQEGGSYLLRVSSNKESYAMSYSKHGGKAQAEVKSVVIECNRGKFNVQKDQHIFDSIPELLAKHEHAKHKVSHKADIIARIELIKKGQYNQDNVSKIPPVVYAESKSAAPSSQGPYGPASTTESAKGQGYTMAKESDNSHGNAYGAATGVDAPVSAYGAASSEPNIPNPYGSVDQTAQANASKHG